MKYLANLEGLAVNAIIATANLPQGTSMKITGNKTVDKATANTFSIGELRVPVDTANAKGTVETRFRARVECKMSGDVAAGEYIKMGAPDGTTGEDTVVKFVPGTDAEERKRGICWSGGTSGNTGEFLIW